jgi:hypothetical protein
MHLAFFKMHFAFSEMHLAFCILHFAFHFLFPSSGSNCGVKSFSAPGTLYS